MKVEITELAGLRAGGVRHIGPHMEIGKAFERLGRIVERAGLISHGLPGSGRTRKPGPNEIYRNNPMTPPAAELMTEIYIPVL
jgi:DNA gyrase inhibitor GyrI